MPKPPNQPNPPTDVPDTGHVSPLGRIEDLGLPIGGFDGMVAWVPRRIGNYRVKRLIASGGMGAVFEAVQDSPRRTVALKVMKPGLSSRSALRRFEYEAQVLARLRHAGIAQIFEAGTHEDTELSGREPIPFFVMEYIPNARPINEYVAINDTSLKDRLQLFVKVCDAINHGHTKGIIHRDLKPNNILVDSAGNPKVIDFGVARATDSDMAVTTLQTDVGQLIGTLQWMSPEQVDADPHDLDTRSDVYSLGVVFFELLTGKLPYNILHAPVYEAARIVREVAPEKPSSLSYLARGDLEIICLKALEKDRNRRYRSAAEMADDVTRFLNNEPITARATTALYELRMLAKRNRPLFVSMVAIATVLVASTLALLVMLRGAWSAETKALDATDHANKAIKLLGGIMGLDESAIDSGAPAVREQLDTLRGILETSNIPAATAAEIHADLARLYFRLGESGTAARSAEKAVEVPGAPAAGKNPSQLALMHTIRGLHERAENLPSAMNSLRSAETERPGEWYTRNNLAVLMAEDQQPERARADLRRLLDGADRVDPSVVRVVAENLTVVLCALGKWPDAQQVLLAYDLPIPSGQDRSLTGKPPLHLFAKCRFPREKDAPGNWPANAAAASLIGLPPSPPVLTPRSRLEKFESAVAGARESRTDAMWRELAQFRETYRAEGGTSTGKSFRDFARSRAQSGLTWEHMERTADAVDALLGLGLPMKVLKSALDAVLAEAARGAPATTPEEWWSLARRHEFDVAAALAQWPAITHGTPPGPAIAAISEDVAKLTPGGPERAVGMSIAAAWGARDSDNAGAIKTLQSALREVPASYHGGTRELRCLLAICLQRAGLTTQARDELATVWNTCPPKVQLLLRAGASTDGHAGYDDDLISLFHEAREAARFVPP